MGDALNVDPHVKMQKALEEIINQIEDIQTELKQEHLVFGASLDKYHKLESLKNNVRRASKEMGTNPTGQGSIGYDNPQQLELPLYPLS